MATRKRILSAVTPATSRVRRRVRDDARPDAARAVLAQAGGFAGGASSVTDDILLGATVIEPPHSCIDLDHNPSRGKMRSQVNSCLLAWRWRSREPGIAAKRACASKSVAPWNLTVQRKFLHRTGGEKFLDQCQKPLGITDDVGKEPVDRPNLARLEREGARASLLDMGHREHVRIERRFVDCNHARTEFSEHVAPPARARAEIEAGFAGLWSGSEQGQRFPKLEIGTARRCAVFDEIRFTVGKGARAGCRRSDGLGIE